MSMYLAGEKIYSQPINNGLIINNNNFQGAPSGGNAAGLSFPAQDLLPSRSSSSSDDYGKPTSLVAPDEKARVWGDPHIEGGDGDKYDFHEKGVYNLLEDKGVSLNGRMDGKGKESYMTEAGLNIDGQDVQIGADGKVMIGQGEQASELQDGETRQLGDGSYIKKDGKDIQVGTPEYKMNFETGKKHNGQEHMDVTVKTKDGGVMLDGQKPTGIVGETFDADKDKQDKPKEDPAQYKRDGLFDSEKSQPRAENPGPSCCGGGSPIQDFSSWLQGVLFATMQSRGMQPQQG